MDIIFDRVDGPMTRSTQPYNVFPVIAIVSLVVMGLHASACAAAGTSRGFLGLASLDRKKQSLPCGDPIGMKNILTSRILSNRHFSLLRGTEFGLAPSICGALLLIVLSQVFPVGLSSSMPERWIILVSLVILARPFPCPRPLLFRSRKLSTSSVDSVSMTEMIIMHPLAFLLRINPFGVGLRHLKMALLAMGHQSIARTTVAVKRGFSFVGLAFRTDLHSCPCLSMA